MHVRSLYAIISNVTLRVMHFGAFINLFAFLDMMNLLKEGLLLHENPGYTCITKSPELRSRTFWMTDYSIWGTLLPEGWVL